jgi:pyrroline-5-carboxylate reductase
VTASPTPILLLGAGRMGGALIAGWLRAGAVAPGDLLLRDPNPSEEALAAAKAGARLNPPDDALGAAATVILAVKPQAWLPAARAIAPHLAKSAVVLSIMAGIELPALEAVFPGHPLARVMPTTAVAIGMGAISVYAPTAPARTRARTVFESLGVVIDLEDEARMHAATAVSGSGPAYLYAFVEALAAAAVTAGFEADAARRLAVSTTTGAAALLAAADVGPDELRRQVTSPGGTTEAALRVLIGDGALENLVTRAVAAAVARSRELAA